jgi:hypothetical protein
VGGAARTGSFATARRAVCDSGRGLSEDIEDGAAAAVVEIADATFFFGPHPHFETASRIEITQFEYSVACADVPMRFSDVKKTVEKFCIAEIGFNAKYGGAQTQRKFRYSLITNRPISNDLFEAVRAATSSSVPLCTGAKSQYEQL